MPFVRVSNGGTPTSSLLIGGGTGGTETTWLSWFQPILYRQTWDKDVNVVINAKFSVASGRTTRIWNGSTAVWSRTGGGDVTVSNLSFTVKAGDKLEVSDSGQVGVYYLKINFS